MDVCLDFMSRLAKTKKGNYEIMKVETVNIS